MASLFYLLTIIGAIIGGGFLFISLGASNSAPQEAAGAAIAVAFAVIPYCLARATQELGRK